MNLLKVVSFALAAVCLYGAGCSLKKNQSVILVAFDGCRWNYPELTDTPNFDYLAANGVRAKSMIPSFPTKTFPNFYTLATGLHPDHHGIVANNMYDGERDAYFRISDRSAVQDPSWWGGEPIWVTAEKNDIRTASYFWVGSEVPVKGIQPTYWYEYDGGVPNEKRIKQVFDWLEKPPKDRPRFITLYFSLLDDVGHRFATTSPEIVSAIGRADSLIGKLLNGLKNRKLTNEVNVVLVSDHGMTDLSPERVVFIDDYVDLADVQMVDWSPIAAINPKNSKLESIYQKLKSAHPRLQVYKKEELPKRFVYGSHKRVPQIIALADEGWSITSRGYFERNRAGFNGATHGYDNSLESMGAIFLAMGPAFKQNLEISSFSNIHIYELMAYILGIQAAPNDGSLDSVKVMLK